MQQNNKTTTSTLTLGMRSECYNCNCWLIQNCKTVSQRRLTINITKLLLKFRAYADLNINPKQTPARVEPGMRNCSFQLSYLPACRALGSVAPSQLPLALLLDVLRSCLKREIRLDVVVSKGKLGKLSNSNAETENVEEVSTETDSST